MYRRSHGLNQDKSEWVKRVSSILIKYGNTVHNTINIKPVDSVKKENHLWVSWHLWDSAKRDRTYPKIAAGSC